MRRRLVSSTFLVVLMVVILLGTPLAVLEVRSVDQSSRSLITTEARLLAQSVRMAIGKANELREPPLARYQTDFQSMIQLDHYGKIVEDGQPPLYLNEPNDTTPDIKLFSAPVARATPRCRTWA